MPQSYYLAPPGWTHTSPNPFTRDGAYGHSWSAWCILDRADGQFFTGQSGDGPFSARFARDVSHLPERLADFQRYEAAHGRTVILSFPPDIDGSDYIARALACTPASSIVRPHDPAILVHATSRSAWAAIQADGELKAASLLPGRAQSTAALGPLAEYLRHEPPEYPDYIMFGEFNSIGPETVVASYQTGSFVWDGNAVFQPGMRLYFNGPAIIRDGLAVRDGLHIVKAHLRLPLTPYLLAAVSVEDLDPGGEVKEWTIKHFVLKANTLFRNKT